MHCVLALRDLGDKGNIIAEAQLLSRRDKGCNHRAPPGGERTVSEMTKIRTLCIARPGIMAIPKAELNSSSKICNQSEKSSSSQQ